MSSEELGPPAPTRPGGVLLWTCWILPLLHFAVVAATAYAVHYANGINVGGFRGDFGLWQGLGNRGCDLIAFSRWAVPALSLATMVVARGWKKKEVAMLVAGSVSIFVATWPVYSGLIRFWERNWVPG